MKTAPIDGTPLKIQLPVHLEIDPKTGVQCIVDSDDYFICTISRYWDTQLVNLINVNQVSNKY